MDSDSAPTLLAREHRLRIVVRAPARHHRDRVPAPGQLRGQIAQVLGRRDDVRVKRLVEQKEFQNKKLKS
jgi:hypothetical protein